MTSTTNNALFQQAVTQAKAGNKATARNLLEKLVAIEPANESAWLYLAAIASNRTEAEQALEKVTALNPQHPNLPKARVWLEKTWPAPAPEPLPASLLSRPQIMLMTGLASVAILLSLVGVAFAFLAFPKQAAANFVNAVLSTPVHTQEEQAATLTHMLAETETGGNPLTEIAVLQQMYSLNPEDSATAAKLAQRYFEQGLALRNEGAFEQAQYAFGKALEIEPQFEQAKKEQHWVSLYQTGVKHHQNAEWNEAIAAFEEIHGQFPNYPHIAEILYSAYFNAGVVYSNQENLTAALEAFEKAKAILPNAPEAPRKVAEVRLLLNPPTPTPTATLVITETQAKPKRVVVDISDQRAFMIEGEETVQEFIVSTGEPGRDTAIGEFEIQNKIPVAYASAWNLDMPFWLGIYYSGPLQNGFHAVPTVRDTGVTMWDGYLGQRVSYGCIILSMEDAETLYNWVDVGTPVSIQW